MDRQISNKNLIKIIMSILVGLIIVFMKPMGMNLEQSMILGSLAVVLIWWTTNIVNRTIASIVLLLVFSLVGGTDLKLVFKFPLTSDFLLIILSFLLSQGIVNSNIANRFSNFALSRYGNTGKKLVTMSFIIGFVVMIIIPQSFSRVILMASIYTEFLSGKDIKKETKDVLMYSIFVASTVLSMIVLNGDMILNKAALQVGDIDLSYLEWIKYMSIPSILSSILVYIAYNITFRKELEGVVIPSEDIESSDLSKKEKIVILVMGLTVILWMTESIHGINSALVALVSTIIMLITGIIKTEDYKIINFELLIFLTAAFSIGGVMNSTGVANILYSQLLNMLPQTNSQFMYLAMIMLLIIVLHMILGSAMTSISVAIPGLIQITSGKIPVIPLVLMAYVTLNMHYILPFHNATIMIGAGKYYSNNVVLKFGIVLTFLIFIMVFGLFIPWWKIIGVL